MDISGLIMMGEDRSTRRKICSSATLTTIKFTWADLGFKPGFRGERLQLTASAMTPPQSECLIRLNKVYIYICVCVCVCVYVCVCVCVWFKFLHVSEQAALPLNGLRHECCLGWQSILIMRIVGMVNSLCGQNRVHIDASAVLNYVTDKQYNL